MTFDARETSNEDGRPVTLYRFKWGKTYWRYTNADEDVLFTEMVEGEPEPVEVTYVAKAVGDDGMIQGGSSQNDFTFYGPSNLPICALFRSTPPSETINLIVRRIHQDDGEAPIYWIGTVANVGIPSPEKCQITGNNLTSSFNRVGLRLCWTRGCPHALYDSQCRVNPEDFVVPATITAMDGNSITVDAAGGHAAGYFDGGFLTWFANADETIDRRGIEQSLTGLRFRLLGQTDRLTVGLAVKLYPGCALDDETCDVKFDNLANYGGLRQMAGQSPFGGAVVF